MPDQHIDVGSLVPTEQVNPNTSDIDLLSTQKVLERINTEDKLVPIAVEKAIPEIALIVDKVIDAFEQGGRLFYVGAGTSGRLGVLDASECPPTFSTPPDLVQGIIAGGDRALRDAIEGAEDSAEEGKKAIETAGVGAKDVLIGISASGGAKYVVSAIETAKAIGAFTGAITCHPQGALAKAADVAMVADVGPEVLTGSTRMKAGTAQKLILNMITTAAMIGWGKTYRNLMVDLTATNEKLEDRACRLVSALAACTLEEAKSVLGKSDGRVKTAVVMQRWGLSRDDALARLKHHHGKLRALFEEVIS